MWQSDNDDDGNRGVRINYVMEFGNYGYKDELTGAGWRDVRTGWNEEIPKRHWHLNDPGVMPNLVQTGAGSPTGITVYEGTLLPEVFHGQTIHCDAGPNVVRSYPAKPYGAGYTAETVNLVDAARDNWFRPSDVCVAPDGSVFIADWYDPGVGGHRMGDVERGRIFRVAPPNHQYNVKAIDTSTLEGAIEALKSPNNATRYLGWVTLQNAGTDAVGPLLMLWNSKEPHYRARALWALGKLPLSAEQKLNVLKTANVDENPMIRVTGVRLARQLMKELPIDQLKIMVNLYDASPAVRREILIGIRDSQVNDGAYPWTEMALQHDGQDRWYLEALGIAAEGHWDEYLSLWLSEVGDDWNSPAGRDIIWRSRSSKSAELLIKIISDPQTPVEELPRYFRSLDFCPSVSQDALANLAFTIQGEPARADYIRSEAIARLNNIDFDKNPDYRAALNRLLDSKPESQTFVSIVDRFKMQERYPDLIAIATKLFDQQVGIDAARVLISNKEWKLLIAGMRTQDPKLSSQLAQAVGLTAENAAVGPLKTVMLDAKTDIRVRRSATSGLSHTRNGTMAVVDYANSKKFPKNLEQAIAAVLHASQHKSAKDTANRLFPLPPSKDAKPLPPLSELAQRKGDVKNGRLVYHTHGTCAKCHMVNNLGKEVGPDLSEIGKKLSRQAMFESILYPSAGISHNYEAYTVVTIEGNIVTGLKVSQTDEEISIKNAEGFVKTVKMDDVEELVKQDVSLMPADLQKVMTEKELVDVVEYLTTLKEKKAK